MIKRSQKQIIAEAFEILLAPGGTCDPYADGRSIGDTPNEDLLRESIASVLTDMVANNPDLTSAEEIVDEFNQIFDRIGANGEVSLRRLP
jgi:hypothetical protein